MSRCYSRFPVAWIVGCGWILSVGVGCTSAPVRYYTLTPPPGREAPAALTTPAIDVRIVHATPQLNRSELMVRSGASEVVILENEKWAAPVADEITHALRLELQRRLSRTNVLGPDIARLTLEVDVQHFDAELGRYALLETAWRASMYSAAGRATGGPTAACAFRAEEKINAGYADMVAGYQREISALADAIVAALARSTDASYAPCH